MAITVEQSQQVRLPHSPATLEAVLTKLEFSEKQILLHFADGRILSAPLHLYPRIEELSQEQRAAYTILGGVGFMFDESDYVYHISDFLGSDNRQGL